MTALKILHVFRAPVGGLFRHVLDLAREQAVRGHKVGLICDSGTGGPRAESQLGDLAPSLALGLSRYPMHRQPHPGDCLALLHVSARIAQTQPDIIHGHGAKGGAYSRLAFNRPSAVRAYIPHGGSLLFGEHTLAGKVYLTTERLLMRRGDLFLFESEFSAGNFKRKLGVPSSGIMRVVHNGVPPAEFEPVAPRPDATDLVFIGEMRKLKGVDLLIEAVARLRREGRSLTATLFGDGPDRAEFTAQAERLALNDLITFKRATPAREAQSFGRLMVMPSRIDSMPYVVLEAAASCKPLLATRVGGIPEIYGPFVDRLVPPEDAGALAQAISRALDRWNETLALAREMQARVSAHFSLGVMVDGVVAAYQAALENLRKAGRR
ncbi:MAG TPA: glycosyltransferase family 4 protein [Pseudolabrys sp.]|nr:glycosyltransferase family 4 protein [Pseudolabrys sp.]